MKKSKIIKNAAISSLLAVSTAVPALAQELPEADKLTNFDLDQIVVVGSRIPEKITQAKADISVVSRREIETMHMATVEEALRTVPGVQFLNYGANGINANLSGIRINGSKDIVVLIDGVRVTDFQGSGSSGYMYSSLLSNMDNIERVEVLRGAAGTIYGSGAKGGVINIVTRGIKSNKSVIDVSKGSFGKESYKFNTQGKRGKVGYNVYYNKSLFGDSKDGDGNRWEGHTDSKNLGAKFTYDFNNAHKLTIMYDEMKSDYSGRDYIYKGPFAGTYEASDLTLKHDFVISENWSNSLTYRKNDVRTFYGKPSEYYGIASDFSYDFISEQATFSDSRHTVVMGLDYSKGYDNRLTRIGYDPETGSKISGNRSMKNYSYYIQDDWKIIPKVTLSGGLRHDKPEGDEYSPEMASNTSKSYKLSWDITDNDIIYACRSDFYILPSMDQLYNEKWGNAKLAPAEGRTSSIGYNKKFDDYNILTVNWFKTESEKSIGYTGDGHYQNFDNAVARGWNVQYMTQIGKHWNANIGWSHLFHHAGGDNYEMGYYPKDLATFGIYYNYAKVSAGFNGFYFMRKINPNYADKQGWPGDNYGVFNLSVNYAPTKNMTFYTKVDNIFDKLWAEHTNVVHGGKPGTWYAMPGRSIIVGMQLKF